MRSTLLTGGLIPLILICLQSTGQVSDSSASAPADSNRVEYFLEKDFSFSPPSLQITDTTLNYFQKYDPASYPGNEYATLGNIGLAHHNLLFSPALTLEFDPGVHSFDLYRFQHQDVRFYKTLKPHSELRYVMGKYREQYFWVDFSQRISKNLNVGLNFRVLSAFGGYVRQKSDDKSVVLKTSYFTKNQRYGIIANLLHNGLTMQENGGIKYDSVFEDKIETDPQLIVINLNKAENKWKENSFRFSHYYSLTKTKDTTIHLEQVSRIFQPGSIAHSFQMSKQWITYSDQGVDTLFYHDIVLDSAYAKDLMQVESFENQFKWTNSRSNTTALALSLSAKYLFNKIQYFSHDSLLNRFDLNHLYYAATITLRPFPQMELNGEAEIVHGDYMNGDTRLTAWILNRFSTKNKEYSLMATASYIRKTPSWFNNYHISNYFEWENSFDKENILHAGISFNHTLTDLTLNYYHHSRFIYYNTMIQPVQADKDLDVIQISGHTPLHFRHFIFDTWLVYQYVSKKEFIRLPSFMADLSAYFDQDLFKGALITQLGFDLHYQPGYYADAYMPSTRIFYVQDEKELKPLIILDVVWKFQVKRARFFLMYHHLNSLVGKQDYYLVPHYPLQDGRIKFGVSWRFHD